MINGYDQHQIQQWKTSLYDYQKQKRTKKPFGKDSSIYQKKIVHSSEIKEKQREFDPILQRYSRADKEMSSQEREKFKQDLSLVNYLKNVKASSDYDIVNLHPYQNQREENPQNSHQEWSKNLNKHNPVRNLYNIINNQSLPSSHYKNRKLKVDDRQTSRKIYQNKLKNPSFDIVKAQYVENNDQKQMRERGLQEEKIREKLSKSHQFDNILQRYYDPQQQWQFQQQLQRSQLAHGKDYQNQLPPSYRNRQPYLPSYPQASQLLPPALKRIIQKEQNTLKRHQLRYAIEDEYKRRNDEEYEKHEELLKNKVHEGKILQAMAKEYDIVNNKLKQMKSSVMYQKKLKENPYSYEFLKQQKQDDKNRQNYRAGHNRSASSGDVYNESGLYNNGNHINGISQNERIGGLNNWQARSQASSQRYSQRSRSSAGLNNNQQDRRFSIKSGGFN